MRRAAHGPLAGELNVLGEADASCAAMPQTTSSFLREPPPGFVVDDAPDADLCNLRYPGAAARLGRSQGSREMIDSKFGSGGSGTRPTRIRPPRRAGRLEAPLRPVCRRLGGAPAAVAVDRARRGGDYVGKCRKARRTFMCSGFRVIPATKAYEFAQVGGARAWLPCRRM